MVDYTKDIWLNYYAILATRLTSANNQLFGSEYHIHKIELVDYPIQAIRAWLEKPNIFSWTTTSGEIDFVVLAAMIRAAIILAATIRACRFSSNSESDGNVSLIFVYYIFVYKSNIIHIKISLYSIFYDWPSWEHFIGSWTQPNPNAARTLSELIISILWLSAEMS